MKKAISILLAVILLSLTLGVSADTAQGFVAPAGRESDFKVNSDKSLTFTSGGNPSIGFSTDTGTKDYTIEVYVKIPVGEKKDASAVISLNCTGNVWTTGLAFKLQNTRLVTGKNACALYDFGTKSYISRVVGLTFDTLNISDTEYNKVKIVRTAGKFNIYINDMLTYENVATDLKGTQIVLGGNLDAANSDPAFKAFTYTPNGGKAQTYLTDGKETPKYTPASTETESSEVTSSEATSSSVSSSTSSSVSKSTSSSTTSKKTSSNTKGKSDGIDPSTIIIIIVCVVVLAGAGAAAFIIIKKNKKKV